MPSSYSGETGNQPLIIYCKLPLLRYACLNLCTLCLAAAGCETNDISAVMDGDLDAFISQYLRHKSKQQQEARLAAPTVQ